MVYVVSYVQYKQYMYSINSDDLFSTRKRDIRDILPFAMQEPENVFKLKNC